MTYWIIHIIIIGLFSFLIYRHYLKEIPAFIYFSGLLLKLAAGLVLGWIFFNEYKSGDTISYYNKASALSSLPLKEYFGSLLKASTYEVTNQPRVLFFNKFLSFFLLITGGSYWISSLYLSLISFLCTCRFVEIVIKFFPALKKWIFISFFFVPTIVFWSSGIIKDSLAFGALLYLIAITLLLYFDKRPLISDLLISLISIFILWRVRHYLLIGFILFIGFLLFIKWVKSANRKKRLIGGFFLVVSLILTQFVHPFLNLRALPNTFYTNNKAIIERTSEANRLDLAMQSSDWSSIIEVFPKALKVGLLRPSLFDKVPFWGIFHQVENGIMAIMMILSILIFLKQKPKVNRPIFIASFTIIFMMVALLAISTPNFGTLVRYKNPFFCFLFFLTGILPFQFFAIRKVE